MAGLYPECVLNPVSAPVGAGNKYFLLEEKQVKKRILSLFLAIVMVLGVLPFSAWAAEPETAEPAEPEVVETVETPADEAAEEPDGETPDTDRCCQ